MRGVRIKDDKFNKFLFLFYFIFLLLSILESRVMVDVMSHVTVIMSLNHVSQ